MGKLHRLDPAGGNTPLQSWAFGAGALAPIGPYAGEQRVLITCSAGSITATVGDAVLGAARQSNQLGGNIRGAGSNCAATTDSVVGGGSIKCWGGAISAWDDFHAVQLMYFNHTTVPATVDNTIVGSIASAWPGGTFNIAAVPPGGWSAQSGAVVVPAATGGDPTARGHMPGFALGPKLAVRSVARAAGEADGGKYPLLVFRNVTLAGNATPCYFAHAAGFPAAYDPVNEGFSILTAAPVFGADCVATPGNWVASTREDAPAMLTFGAVFYYDKKVKSICGLGDSTMGGLGDGSSQRSPYLFKAAARIKASGKRVSYANQGINGSKMAETNTRGKALISAVGCDILVLHTYTVNDLASLSLASTWDAQWYNVMDLAQAQLAAGKQVLLITPLPLDSLNSTQNALRLIQLRRTLDAGLPCANMESLADPVTGHWADSGSTADGTHPLAATHERMAAIVQPILDSMIL